MEDDFGSRGNIISLPLLNHDEDRPMNVKDRELADVIIESFDSLTKTFDGFAKNLKPLDRRDVYEATKKAIIDTNAYGGRSGGGNSMVIKEASAPDIPEVREYWKRKTQIEVNKAQRQSEDLMKNDKKKAQDNTNNELSEIIKWVTQAQTNSLAFMEDFLVKKALMPLIFKLGGGDKEVEKQKRAEEERLKKLDEQYNRQEEHNEVMKENTHILVDMREILRENADYVLDRYETILHEQLGLFGNAFGTALVSVLSGGQTYSSSQYGGGSRLQLGNVGLANQTASDIDAQDDDEDVQDYYDDTTLLIESPRDTPLGELIEELIPEKESESEEKEKEKDEEEKKSLLGTFGKLAPTIKGILILSAIVAGVTAIVNIANKIYSWLHKTYDPEKSDLSIDEQQVASGNALQASMKNSQWDTAKENATEMIYYGGDNADAIVGYTVDDGLFKSNKYKILQDPYVKYANLALDKLQHSNPEAYEKLVAGYKKHMSDSTSGSFILDKNGRASETRIRKAKETLQNKEFADALYDVLREEGIDVLEDEVYFLNEGTLTDSATYNGVEGSGLIFDAESERWTTRSLKVPTVTLDKYNEKQRGKAATNMLRTEIAEKALDVLDSEGGGNFSKAYSQLNKEQIINNFENQVVVYQPNAKVEFDIPTAN